MTRPTYVYRLRVEYPEGVDWRNPPEAWEADEWQAADGSIESREFQWPRVRPYLSASGAKARADLLRKYGCTVEIERSEPVRFSGEGGES